MLSISTKTGDKGETSLAAGLRLPKDHQVFDVIGTIDELNSWLGLTAVGLKKVLPKEQKFVLEIQHKLFTLGAEIAQAPKVKFKKSFLTKLEKRSENLQASLEKNWHQKFLLPGGSQLAAQLDIARTVCRRAERELVSYDKVTKVSATILQFINRLSDYLYLLRCVVNFKQKVKEIKFS